MEHIFLRLIYPNILKYLVQLKGPTHLQNPPQPIITVENFQEGLKQAKGKTFRGNQLHFEHIKACAADPDHSEFESTLCHIPYAIGYSLQQWRKSTSVMLLKKNKGYKVDYLRTIQLVDSNFNFTKKSCRRYDDKDLSL